MHEIKGNEFYRQNIPQTSLKSYDIFILISNGIG